MKKNLVISKLQCEFHGILLRTYWFPSETLDHNELATLRAQLEVLNSGSDGVDYGYFAKNASEKERLDFLAKSIWSILYFENQPVGFAYNIYVGEAGGKSVVHAGLVKLARKLGKDALRLPYFPMTMGNLVNFGPFYYTNISHVPSIVEAFSIFYLDVWPTFEKTEHKNKDSYKAVLELLTEKYVVPVLGLKREMVNYEKSTIEGSMAAMSDEFETDWKRVAKSNIPDCNRFMENLLTFVEDSDGIRRVEDDIMQVATIDFRFFSRPYCAETYNKFIWQGFEPSTNLTNHKKTA